jgi:cation-transporting ATPase 13A1
MSGRGVPQVASSEIASLELLNPLPGWLHLYVWPFAILYPMATYAYVFQYEAWLHEEQANTFLLCLALFGSHALTFLATKWSATFRTRTTCLRVRPFQRSYGAGSCLLQTNSLKQATLVRVVPFKNQGHGEIVPLQKTRRATAEPLLSFTYNRDKYLYDAETHGFARLAYPIDAVPPPSLASFQHSKGIETSSQVTFNQTQFGKNTFDIPVPSFREIFGEHAVAPFFVFQLFCVGLWCLDEYWYYSLFTLFMLVVFECTVVFQVCMLLTTLTSLNASVASTHAVRIPHDEHQTLHHQRLPRRLLVRDPVRRLAARRPCLHHA